jgi:ABC-type polysaccharide/polyol phosphate export permease
LDATFQMSGNPFGRAIHDLREGVRLAPIWWRLSVEQTITRYRRTLLGPLWIALSTVGFAAGLALVFGPILGGDWRTNFPFVFAGLLAWGLVGGVVMTGSQVFLGASGLMQTQKLPLSFHAFQAMSRHAIDFSQQLIAFWVVMAALRLFPVPHWELVFALPLILVTGFFLTFPLGMLATRYRDVAHFMGLIMQTLFLLTPVFWRRASMPPQNHWIVDYNPFAYLLEILRQPLLGHPAGMKYWSGALMVLVVSAAAALISLMLYRRRVIFWL